MDLLQKKVWKMFLMVCVNYFIVLLFICSDAQASIKLGLMAYSPINDTNTQRWIDQRFPVRVEGWVPHLAGVKRFNYYDIHGIYLDNYVPLKEWADSKKIRYEDIFLHSKTNYSYTPGTAWTNLDAFGVFEGNSYTPKNGVIKQTGTTFQDLSSDAYFGKKTVTLDNAIFLGYMEPFTEVRFALSTAGSSVKTDYQYYNGTSWAALTIADSTLDFTRDGTVTFEPPADWDTVRVNNSKPKYFIKLVFSSAIQSPVAKKISGDTWKNPTKSALDSCRGWDPTAPGVNNRNPRFSYNCNPPPGANAKFQYQARISFWSDNHFICNPADRQIIDGTTQYTWASFCAKDIIASTEANGGFSGTMCDDASATINVVTPAQTDFSDKAAGATWDSYTITRFKTLYNNIKSANPQLLIGLNSYDPKLVFSADWNVSEMHTFVWQTNSWGGVGAGTQNTNWSTTYDNYLPDSNAHGTFAVMFYYDPYDTLPNGAIFDRSNRGPMAALTKHYIAMNDNTYLLYHSTLGYTYSETDEVFLKNGQTIHQSVTPLAAGFDLTQVRRWGPYCPAMGVDIGIPDANGYNGGKRDVAWKKAADIDTVLTGGKAHGDVWRRDFTNAIILHRPGENGLTKKDYDSYSKPIPLGTTYYPLDALGKTGPGVTGIALRLNEGVILMKKGTTTQSVLVQRPNKVSMGKIQDYHRRNEISYMLGLSSETLISARIIDLQGRLMEELSSKQTFKPGNYQVTWRLKNKISGMYLLVIKIGAYEFVYKLL